MYRRRAGIWTPQSNDDELTGADDGSLDLKLGAGAEAMTINAKLQGRWLSADCGDEAEGDDDAETRIATALTIRERNARLHLGFHCTSQRTTAT